MFKMIRYLKRGYLNTAILFKLIAKVPVVGNTADTPNPPGLLPF